ncbi:MAG TPA: folylpolyglutamate synthase/dihydrofolate synthase family protein [Pirellulales bacterium]|jgi:dihydrofolate synthase/folylpolyglutamate synthase|nr:folylpolyglutamate synthase/dihydrofolate synthase family protein [Pirellulales bacterium]
MRVDDSNAAHSAALAFLLSRIDFERALSVPYHDQGFKLERMRKLLERLGNPQDRLKIVHIAGTKGKGSTAAMISSCLTAAGYRTGLFSSPHLERVEERFAIDGQICSADELTALVEQVRPAVASIDADAILAADTGPTYFEITTALGLLYFVRQGVHTAVLEVGMGGRLDSTNVCVPAVAVITSISFDHTEQLGNTLAKIAGEKAGIIKPRVPVVSGVTNDEPRAVIEAVCRERAARLEQLPRDFWHVYHPPQDGAAVAASFDFHTARPGPFSDLRAIPLTLLGSHQAANGAVAIATLAELARQGWRIDAQAIARGFARLNWPARIEIVHRRPTIVLDVAHNVASIAALLEALRGVFAARRKILIFATTRDKDARGMLELLLPEFDEVVLTRYGKNPRGLAVEELLALAEPLGHRCLAAVANSREAWSRVLADTAADDLVCITGSFFLAAEMREEMAARPLGAESGSGSGFQVADCDRPADSVS